MGRHRTVRYQLRQSKRRAKSFRGTSDDVPLHLFYWLARLLQRHSFLLLMIALAILIGAATAAVRTILDPNASIPYSVAHANGQPASAPSVSLPTATPQVSLSPSLLPELPSQSTAPAPTAQRNVNRHPQSSPSPISAGGILLLSCATGCFLLSQWVKPRASTRSHPRATGLVKSETAPPSTASPPLPSTEANSASEFTQLPISQPSFLVSKLQPPSTAAAVTSSKPSVDPVNLVNPVNPVNSVDSATAAELPVEVPVETSVTVVPADRDHPLDWDEPSLADSLDLRQRRPLSYWL
jgi:hypothetical protein